MQEWLDAVLSSKDAGTHLAKIDYDVYAAGEAPIPGVSGKTLVDSIMAHKPRTQCAWMPHRLEVVPYLCTKLRPGDLVLTMGAGDVTTMGPQIVAALEGRE